MKILNAISILVVLSGISCLTFAADSPKYLADRHAAKQIPCEWIFLIISAGFSQISVSVL